MAPTSPDLLKLALTGLAEREHGVAEIWLRMPMEPASVNFLWQKVEGFRAHGSGFRCFAAGGGKKFGKSA
jgi:hypothetical protein